MYTRAVETTTISKNGAHQAALRRKSVKVLVGAMKVFIMRAPWDSGGVDGAGLGVGEPGVTGAETMNASCGRVEGILVGSGG